MCSGSDINVLWFWLELFALAYDMRYQTTI